MHQRIRRHCDVSSQGVAAMDRRSPRKTIRVPRADMRTPLVAQDGARPIRADTKEDTLNTIDPVPLAVRVYPEPPEPRTAPDRRRWRRPDLMLVFDTETRIDATQRLTFGSYRFIVRGRCLEEGLFSADDLPAADRAVLARYVRTHDADVH